MAEKVPTPIKTKLITGLETPTSIGGVTAESFEDKVNSFLAEISGNNELYVSDIKYAVTPSVNPIHSALIILESY